VPLVAPDAPLTDGVVELRPIDETDLGTIERAALDEELAPRFGLATRSASDYLAGYRAALAAGTAAAFGIRDADRAESVGQVIVEVRGAGRADLGYWLLAEARGRGLATRGVRLVSRWALEQPGVARLQLWTDPENRASQRVAERCGFQREGVLRAYGQVEGRRVDAVMYSLLPGDLG
jgi:RimJ/RimL family protein N-acetyltransferase